MDEVIGERGPQTHDKLYDLVLDQAITKRYRDIQRSMTSRTLMQLLVTEYEEHDMIQSPKTGKMVVLWGPRVRA